MGKVLNIGIDLGSDTVKVAFAFDNDSGIVYGKFAGKSKLTQVAYLRLLIIAWERTSGFLGIRFLNKASLS